MLIAGKILVRPELFKMWELSIDLLQAPRPRLL